MFYTIANQTKNKFQNFIFNKSEGGSNGGTKKELGGAQSFEPFIERKTSVQEMRQAILHTWPAIAAIGVGITAISKPETFNPILPDNMKIVGKEQKAIEALNQRNSGLKKQNPTPKQAPKI